MSESMGHKIPNPPGRTWRCEKHAREIPVRKYDLPLAGICGTYREECPDCAREERYLEARKRETLDMIEREMETRRRKLDAGVPERYFTADLDGAHQSVTELASAPESCDVGLIILGPNGTGKTWQSCALINDALGRGISAQYTTAMGLMLRIRAAWDHRGADWESESEIIEHLTEVALLAVDEIGKGHDSHSEWVILNHIVNERYANRRPTVLISNLSAPAFKALVGESVADRYREDGGCVVILDGPSRRGKG